LSKANHFLSAHYSIVECRDSTPTRRRIAESEHKTDAPQERLQIFFSTHDVTLTGWRLRDLLRLLRDGKIAAVKTGHARYANLDQNNAFVASIIVTPINKE